MLEARELHKRFGALTAVDGISLAFAAGERVALIGPNGAGKTTLFDLLAGELIPDRGRVLLAGRDVTRSPPETRARLGLGRSFQHAALFGDTSVRDSLTLAALTACRRNWVFWRDPATDSDIAAAVDEIAGHAGLRAVMERPAPSLAHGERRRLEIALTLVQRPRILLLDEPTAGMGPEETGDVLALLRALPGGVATIVVEHDLDLVFGFAGRVIVLDRGRVVFDGTPAEARASREVREIYVGDLGR